MMKNDNKMELESSYKKEPPAMEVAYKSWNRHTKKMMKNDKKEPPESRLGFSRTQVTSVHINVWMRSLCFGIFVIVPIWNSQNLEMHIFALEFL